MTVSLNDDIMYMYMWMFIYIYVIGEDIVCIPIDACYNNTCGIGGECEVKSDDDYICNCSLGYDVSSDGLTCTYITKTIS